ncbi:hypothetical protein [Phenylobacterium sp.]|nr:hypothetical protein [Phenylobacterium sp.]
MTQGLPQQDTLTGFCIPKPAATPQHGQKPAQKSVKTREPRSFTLRPGH